MSMRWVNTGSLGLLLAFSFAASASIELVSRIEGEPPLVMGANGPSSSASMSADGRFVAFQSEASNLGEGDINARANDIFVYDRDTDTTELLTAGGNAPSWDPSISADGRFVAFVSNATNLVAGDTDNDTNTDSNIFVFDRETRTTEQITSGATSDSNSPSISADGRFVAFQTSFNGVLGIDPSLNSDIFVYDRETGTTDLITSEVVDNTLSPAISADGRFVTFRFFDSSPQSDVSFNRISHVFLYDRDSGELSNLTSGANSSSFPSSISADGRFVAFSSIATNLLATGPTNSRGIYVYDRETDTIESLSELEFFRGFNPVISADGNLVSFEFQVAQSAPSDYVVYDRNTGALEVIATTTGSGPRLTISPDGQFVAFSGGLSPELETLGPGLTVYSRSTESFERIPRTTLLTEVAGGNSVSTEASISGNGQFVAFTSFASNLLAEDSNDHSDIFVYDRDTQRNELLVAGADADSRHPSISVDGRFVAFDSNATNLVPGVGPGEIIPGERGLATNIFVHDRVTGTTEALTAGADGRNFEPSISGDGRFVAFESNATNLVAEDTNGPTSDILLYDRETNTTKLLTPGGDGRSATPMMSADGRFVAFTSQASNLVPEDTTGVVFDVFVYDRITDTTELLTEGAIGISSSPSSNRLAISSDGRFVAFVSRLTNLVDGDTNEGNDVFGTSSVFVHDRQSSVTERLFPGADSEGNTVTISADGRFVAFSTLSRSFVQGLVHRSELFLVDRETGSVRLLSQGANGTNSDGGSGSASISSDGRVVAFSSSATNLANDGNRANDVFITLANVLPSADSFAVTTGEDELLTVTLSGIDTDADPLTFEVVTQPLNGELSGTAPDLIYTPNANFFGTDSFTFSANDGIGTGEPGTVSISVIGVNDTPVATGIAIGPMRDADLTTIAVSADTPFTFTLGGSDLEGDDLTYSVVALPANGSLSGEAPNLVYTPVAGYLGEDSFTFTLNDGGGASAPVTVSITVTDSTVTLLSAVLPASRSVEVGSSATAFATLINAGTVDALGCALSLPDSVAAQFSYQASDPNTNTVVSEPNLSVDIPAGASQSFVFSITPSEEMPATEVPLEFSCANAVDATSFVGLNTLLLSASLAPVPDLVALAATITDNGVMELANGTGFFTAATINVGSAATITVSADTGDATLPMSLTLCETDPATSVCINPGVPGTEPVIVDIPEGGSPTFAVFASANEAISLDPANSRVFLRFSDELGLIRGATSVAVENTQ